MLDRLPLHKSGPHISRCYIPSTTALKAEADMFPHPPGPPIPKPPPLNSNKDILLLLQLGHHYRCTIRCSLTLLGSAYGLPCRCLTGLDQLVSS